MTDSIALSVVISRDWLGLPPLNANDGNIYKAAPQLMGGAVQWNRNQVGSPFVDGQVTVRRTREMVSEQLAFEVWGRTNTNRALSNPQLKANMDALTDAFSQDSFTLTLTVDGAVYSYSCEAADYQMVWLGTRFMAKQGQILFTMPRQPVALVGTV